MKVIISILLFILYYIYFTVGSYTFDTRNWSTNGTLSSCVYYDFANNEYYDLRATIRPDHQGAHFASFTKELAGGIQTNYMVYFNPCFNDHMNPDGYSTGTIFSTKNSIGSLNEPHFVTFNTDGITIKYQSTLLPSTTCPGNGNRRTMILVITCDPTSYFTVTSTNNQRVLCEHTIYIKSSLVCKNRGILFNQGLFYDFTPMKLLESTSYQITNNDQSKDILFNLFGNVKRCSSFGTTTLSYQSCILTVANKAIDYNLDSRYATTPKSVMLGSISQPRTITFINNTIVIIYSSTTGFSECPINGNKYSSKYILVCDPSTEYYVDKFIIESQCIYQVKVYTKYACPTLRLFKESQFYDLSPLMLDSAKNYTGPHNTEGSQFDIVFNIGNRAQLCSDGLNDQSFHFACQYDPKINRYNPLVQSSLGQKVTFDYNQVKIEYSPSPTTNCASNSYKRNFIILLTCDESQHYQIVSTLESPICVYTVTIKTKYVCESTVYYNRLNYTYYDITPIKTTKDNPKTADIPVSGTSYRLYYSIGNTVNYCTNLPNAIPGVDYQACQYANGLVIQAGSLKNTTMFLTNKNSILIQHTTPYDLTRECQGRYQRTNILEMICDPTATYTVVSATEVVNDWACQYIIQIKTKYACPINYAPILPAFGNPCSYSCTAPGGLVSTNIVSVLLNLGVCFTEINNYGTGAQRLLQIFKDTWVSNDKAYDDWMGGQIYKMLLTGKPQTSISPYINAITHDNLCTYGNNGLNKEKNSINDFLTITNDLIEISNRLESSTVTKYKYPQNIDLSFHKLTSTSSGGLAIIKYNGLLCHYSIISNFQTLDIPTHLLSCPYYSLPITLSSLTPTSAKAGDTITINGINLNANNYEVNFNITGDNTKVKATIVSKSATFVKVIVPNGFGNALVYTQHVLSLATSGTLSFSFSYPCSDLSNLELEKVIRENKKDLKSTLLLTGVCLEQIEQYTLKYIEETIGSKWIDNSINSDWTSGKFFNYFKSSESFTTVKTLGKYVNPKNPYIYDTTIVKNSLNYLFEINSDILQLIKLSNPSMISYPNSPYQTYFFQSSTNLGYGLSIITFGSKVCSFTESTIQDYQSGKVLQSCSIIPIINQVINPISTLPSPYQYSLTITGRLFDNSTKILLSGHECPIIGNINTNQDNYIQTISCSVPPEIKSYSKSLISFYNEYSKNIMYNFFVYFDKSFYFQYPISTVTQIEYPSSVTIKVIGFNFFPHGISNSKIRIIVNNLELTNTIFSSTSLNGVDSFSFNTSGLGSLNQIQLVFIGSYTFDTRNWSTNGTLSSCVYYNFANNEYYDLRATIRPDHQGAYSASFTKELTGGIQTNYNVYFNPCFNDHMCPDGYSTGCSFIVQNSQKVVNSLGSLNEPHSVTFNTDGITIKYQSTLLPSTTCPGNGNRRTMILVITCDPTSFFIVTSTNNQRVLCEHTIYIKSSYVCKNRGILFNQGLFYDFTPMKLLESKSYQITNNDQSKDILFNLFGNVKRCSSFGTTTLSYQSCILTVANKAIDYNLDSRYATTPKSVMLGSISQPRTITFINNTIVIIYSSTTGFSECPTNGNKYSSKYILVCDPSTEYYVDKFIIESQCIYQVKVYTKYACPTLRLFKLSQFYDLSPLMLDSAKNYTGPHNTEGSQFDIVFNIGNRAQLCSDGLNDQSFHFACQYDPKINRYNPLVQSSLGQKVTFDYNQVKIEYSPSPTTNCASNSYKRNFIILLTCDESQHYQIVSTLESPICVYTVTIKTKYVCESTVYYNRFNYTYYDITPIKTTKDNPKTADIPVSGTSYRLYYSIGNTVNYCTNLPNAIPGVDYQACQYANGLVIQAGSLKNTTMFLTDRNSILIQHTTPYDLTRECQGKYQRTNILEMICDPTATYTVVSATEDVNDWACQYIIKIKTKYACPINYAPILPAFGNPCSYSCTAPGGLVSTNIVSVLLNLGVCFTEINNYGTGAQRLLQIFKDTWVSNDKAYDDWMGGQIYKMLLTGKPQTSISPYINAITHDNLCTYGNNGLNKEKNSINDFLTITNDLIEISNRLESSTVTTYKYPQNIDLSFHKLTSTSSGGLAIIKYNGLLCHYSIISNFQTLDIPTHLTSCPYYSLPITLSSLTPTSAKAGDTITINGINLDGVNYEFYFNITGDNTKVKATIVSKSATFVKVIVPNGFGNALVYTQHVLSLATSGTLSFSYPSPTIVTVVTQTFSTGIINRFFVIGQYHGSKTMISPFIDNYEKEPIYCELEKNCPSTSKIPSISGSATGHPCVESTVYLENSAFFDYSKYDVFVCIKSSLGVGSGTIKFPSQTFTFTYSYKAPVLLYTPPTIFIPTDGGNFQLNGKNFPPTQEIINLGLNTSEIIWNNDNFVTLKGTNLTNVNWKSSTSISCLAPPGFGQSAIVSVTVGKQISTTNNSNGVINNYFINYDYPRAESSLIPVPTDGGETIIKGINFIPTSLAAQVNNQTSRSIHYIIINSYLSPSWTWINSTHVKAMVPKGIGYFIPVVIVGSQSSYPSLRPFYDKPKLDKKEYKYLGGNNITITGSNFIPIGISSDSSSNVKIGGIPCNSITWVDSKSVICNIPTGVGNNLNIEVTVGGQVTDVNDYFSYLSCNFTCSDLSNLELEKVIRENKKDLKSTLLLTGVCLEQIEQYSLKYIEETIGSKWIDNSINSDWTSGKFFSYFKSSESFTTVKTLGKYVNPKNPCIYDTTIVKNSLNYLFEINSDILQLIKLSNPSMISYPNSPYQTYFFQSSTNLGYGLSIITFGSKVCSFTESTIQDYQSGKVLQSCSIIPIINQVINPISTLPSPYQYSLTITGRLFDSSTKILLSGHECPIISISTNQDNYIQTISCSVPSEIKSYSKSLISFYNEYSKNIMYNFFVYFDKSFYFQYPISTVTQIEYPSSVTIKVIGFNFFPHGISNSKIRIIVNNLELTNTIFGSTSLNGVDSFSFNTSDLGSLNQIQLVFIGSYTFDTRNWSTNGTLSSCVFYDFANNEYYDLRPTIYPDHLGSNRASFTKELTGGIQTNYMVYFNLCFNDHMNPDGYSTGTIFSTKNSIGSLNEPHFVTFNTDGITIKYQSTLLPSTTCPGNGNRRTMILVITCDPASYFTVTSTNNQRVLCEHTIYIKSSYVCKNRGILFNQGLFYDFTPMKLLESKSYQIANNDQSKDILFNLFGNVKRCSSFGTTTLSYQSCILTVANKAIDYNLDSRYATTPKSVMLGSISQPRTITFINNTIVIIYSSTTGFSECPTNGNKYSSKYILVCDPSTEYYVDKFIIESQCIYQVKVYTKYACPTLRLFKESQFYDLSPLMLDSAKNYTGPHNTEGSQFDIVFNIGNRAQLCSDGLNDQSFHFACQYDPKINRYNPLVQSSLGQKVTFDYNQVKIEYSPSPTTNCASNSYKRNFIILLTCDESQHYQIVSTLESPICVYTVTIKTKYVCESTVYYNRFNYTYYDITPIKTTKDNPKTADIPVSGTSYRLYYSIGSIVNYCASQTSAIPGVDYQACQYIDGLVIQAGSLKNTTMYLTGNGIEIHHTTPYDKTRVCQGSRYQRTNILEMICDPTATYTVVSATEVANDWACQYIIQIKTKYACPINYAPILPAFGNPCSYSCTAPGGLVSTNIVSVLLNLGVCFTEINNYGTGAQRLLQIFKDTWVSNDKAYDDWMGGQIYKMLLTGKPQTSISPYINAITHDNLCTYGNNGLNKEKNSINDFLTITNDLIEISNRLESSTVTKYKYPQNIDLSFHKLTSTSSGGLAIIKYNGLLCHYSIISNFQTLDIPTHLISCPYYSLPITLSSLTPTSAKAGDTITINGINLDGVNYEVYFNITGDNTKVKATIVSKSATFVKVIVPNGFGNALVYTQHVLSLATSGTLSFSYPSPTIVTVVTQTFSTGIINRFFVIGQYHGSKTMISPFIDNYEKEPIYCELEKNCPSTSKIPSISGSATGHPCVESTVFLENSAFFDYSKYDVFVCIKSSLGVGSGTIKFPSQTFTFTYSYKAPVLLYTPPTIFIPTDGGNFQLNGKNFPPTQEIINLGLNTSEIIWNNDNFVTLKGTNLTNVNWKSSTLISCLAPPGFGQSAIVSVTVGKQISTTNNSNGVIDNYFINYDYPRAESSLIPVPTDGGETIIKGINFIPTSLAAQVNNQTSRSIHYIIINSYLSPSWTWINSTHVKAMVPKGIGRFIPVVIVGSQSSYPSLRPFYDKPKLDKKEYKYLGGNNITITGSNFIPIGISSDSSSNVKIGGIPCNSITWVDSKSVICNIPTGVGNNLNIEVTVGGQATDVNDYFSYLSCNFTCSDLSNLELEKVIRENKKDLKSTLLLTGVCLEQIEQYSLKYIEETIGSKWIDNSINSDWTSGKFFNYFKSSESFTTVKTLGKYVNPKNPCIYDTTIVKNSLNYLFEINSDILQLIKLSNPSMISYPNSPYQTYFFQSSTNLGYGLSIITFGSKVCSFTESTIQDYQSGKVLQSCSIIPIINQVINPISTLPSPYQYSLTITGRLFDSSTKILLSGYECPIIGNINTNQDNYIQTISCSVPPEIKSYSKSLISFYNEYSKNIMYNFFVYFDKSFYFQYPISTVTQIEYPSSVTIKVIGFNFFPHGISNSTIRVTFDELELTNTIFGSTSLNGVDSFSFNTSGLGSLNYIRLVFIGSYTFDTRNWSTNGTLSSCVFYDFANNEYYDLRPAIYPDHLGSHRAEFTKELTGGIQTNYMVYFNPCFNDHMNPDGYSTGTIFSTKNSIGSLNEPHFVTFNTDGITIKYQSTLLPSTTCPGNGNRRTMILVITCDLTSDFTVTSTNNQRVLCEHTIYIKSSLVCKNRGILFNQGLFYDFTPMKLLESTSYQITNNDQSKDILFNLFGNVKRCSSFGTTTLSYQSCILTVANKAIDYNLDSRYATTPKSVMLGSISQPRTITFINNTIVIIYSSTTGFSECPTNGNKYSSKYILVCDPSTEYYVDKFIIESQCIYQVKVYTKYACPTLRLFKQSQFYDLSPLMLDPTRNYTGTHSLSGYQFDIIFNIGNRAQLCSDGLNDQSFHFACQYDPFYNVYYPLAQSSLGQKVTFDYNQVKIEYSPSATICTGNSYRNFIILLTCDESQHYQIVSTIESPICTYTVTIKTKYVCESTVYYNRFNYTYYDITPIKTTKDNPKTADIPVSGTSYRLYYSIGNTVNYCTNLPNAIPGVDYQACQYANGLVIQAGSLKNTTMFLTNRNSILIQHTTPYDLTRECQGRYQRTNILEMICDPTATYTVVSATEVVNDWACQYIIQIKTKYACPINYAPILPAFGNPCSYSCTAPGGLVSTNIASVLLNLGVCFTEINNYGTGAQRLLQIFKDTWVSNDKAYDDWMGGQIYKMLLTGKPQTSISPYINAITHDNLCTYGNNGLNKEKNSINDFLTITNDLIEISNRLESSTVTKYKYPQNIDLSFHKLTSTSSGGLAIIKYNGLLCHYSIISNFQTLDIPTHLLSCPYYSLPITLSSLTPTSAKAGDTITINGINLDGVNYEVYFNITGDNTKVKATIVSKSATFVKVIVPNGFGNALVYTQHVLSLVTSGTLSFSYPSPTIVKVVTQTFSTGIINRFFVIGQYHGSKTMISPFIDNYEKEPIYCELEKNCPSTSKIPSISGSATGHPCVESTVFLENSAFFDYSKYDVFVCIKSSLGVGSGTIKFPSQAFTFAYSYKAPVLLYTPPTIFIPTDGGNFQLNGKNFPPTQEIINLGLNTSEIIWNNDNFVTLKGTNLTNVNWKSSTLISCLAPPGFGQSAIVSVTVGKQISTTNNSNGVIDNYFINYDYPRVESSLIPVPTDGGETIIKGINFIPTSLAAQVNNQTSRSIHYIIINSYLSPSWTWINSTHVKAMVPKGIGRFIPVVIVGSQSSYPSLRPFYDKPKLDKKEYKYLGGNNITITGSNFIPIGISSDSSSNVKIGGIPCNSITWVDSKSVICNIPTGVGNNLNIEVTVGGQVTDVNDYFSYLSCNFTCSDLSNLELEKVIRENKKDLKSTLLLIGVCLEQIEQYSLKYIEETIGSKWIDNSINSDWTSGKFFSYFKSSESFTTVKTLGKYVNPKNPCIYDTTIVKNSLNYLFEINSDILQLIKLSNPSMISYPNSPYQTYFFQSSTNLGYGLSIITFGSKVCSFTESTIQDYQSGKVLQSCSIIPIINQVINPISTLPSPYQYSLTITGRLFDSSTKILLSGHECPIISISTNQDNYIQTISCSVPSEIKSYSKSLISFYNEYSKNIMYNFFVYFDKSFYFQYPISTVTQIEYPSSGPVQINSEIKVIGFNFFPHGISNSTTRVIINGLELTNTIFSSTSLNGVDSFSFNTSGLDPLK
ncbi:hypothetical protein RB653_006924 [Dictyostelium firmibasis]|uniref:MRH domain-containing protein n=1 Tax=Dictyostelium firmibasis TaxID=79012 RepID=A0AAN7U0C9_9MYCE